jgi:hypothetical protein
LSSGKLLASLSLWVELSTYSTASAANGRPMQIDHYLFAP